MGNGKGGGKLHVKFYLVSLFDSLFAGAGEDVVAEDVEDDDDESEDDDASLLEADDSLLPAVPEDDEDGDADGLA